MSETSDGLCDGCHNVSTRYVVYVWAHPDVPPCSVTVPC